jgi:NitT/TauT family transport system substrate-binding protein
MTRKLVALLASVALAMPAAACGSGRTPASTPGKPDKVTVGVIPIIDVSPIYLGKSKGFFTNHNIDLTLSTAQGGAAIVPAVAAGQDQFGFSNTVSVLIASSNGIALKAVASGNSTAGVADADFSGLVVKDAAIKSPKDLVGKKVATNTLKNVVDVSIKELVKKDGGDPGKVNLVELAFPDMAAALDRGDVSGAFLVEPFLSAAKAKGWRVLGSFASVDPTMEVALYVTSANLARSNPDLVARFTAAMKESLAYADAQPDEVRSIIGIYTKIDDATRKAITLPKWPAEINTSSVNAQADLAQSYGWTTKKPDVAALLP